MIGKCESSPSNRRERDKGQLPCCWALAIREYDFKIEYKKGLLNGNADALSRRIVMAITHVGQPLDDMWKAQRDDPIISMM